MTEQIEKLTDEELIKKRTEDLRTFSGYRRLAHKMLNALKKIHYYETCRDPNRGGTLPRRD